jgi:hypothetical protein
MEGRGLASPSGARVTSPGWHQRGRAPRRRVPVKAEGVACEASGHHGAGQLARACVGGARVLGGSGAGGVLGQKRGGGEARVGPGQEKRGG